MDKIQYQNGEEVEFTTDGTWNPTYSGKVVGLAYQNLVDFWLVDVGNPEVFPEYKYQTVSVVSSLMRKKI